MNQGNLGNRYLEGIVQCGVSNARDVLSEDFQRQVTVLGIQMRNPDEEFSGCQLPDTEPGLQISGVEWM